MSTIPTGFPKNTTAVSPIRRILPTTCKIPLLLDNFVMQAWWAAAQGWQDQTVGIRPSRNIFCRLRPTLRRIHFLLGRAVGNSCSTYSPPQGINERTIIVVTSDHGEQFLEHGYFGHGNSGYQVGPARPLYYQRPTAPQHRRSASRQSGQCRRYPAHPAGPAQLANRSGRTGAGALVFTRVRRCRTRPPRAFIQREPSWATGLSAP